MEGGCGGGGVVVVMGPLPRQGSTVDLRKGERITGSEILGPSQKGRWQILQETAGGRAPNRGLYSLQLRNKTESLVSAEAFP